MLLKQVAAHPPSFKRASVYTKRHYSQNQHASEAASAMTKHIHQLNWLKHLHIGRLQAFACINFASATLPRSWVNKDASIEVLLGLSFTVQSKSTTKICEKLSKSKFTIKSC
jgi:hypothetical protein